MNKIFEKAIYLIFTLFLISCGNQKVVNNIKINSSLNSKYKKSRTAYSGKFKKNEHDELVKMLEVELKTKLPKNKSILINYKQKATNCLDASLSEKSISQITNNEIRISSRMSSIYNAIDFFIYTEDSFNKKVYEKLSKFIIDSGFFYNNVFTEHQNCAGFIIIKSNGDFYKRYGEDYYSEVEAFLKKK